MEYMASSWVCGSDPRPQSDTGRASARDNLGYMYGGGADAMLADIASVNRQIERNFSDLPLILMGAQHGFPWQ